MKFLARLSLLLVPAILLAGCQYDPEEDGPGLFANCGPLQQNDYVLSTMKEWYYWYDQIPNVGPGSYENPYDLLEAIRYNTFDSTFSYITTQAAEDAFLNNSAYIGFGFSTTIQNGDQLFLREVFPGSPSDIGGMARGDEILSVDGTSVATLINAGTLQDAYGPSELGVSRSFEVRHPDTSVETIVIAKAEVDIPVVQAAQTFDVNGATTGYVYFRSFNNAAFDALGTVFTDFSNAGVTKIILDLRYNGGGLISVAEFLGSLLYGDVAGGQEFSTMRFNDKKQVYNVLLQFSNYANSLGITDLVVITTGGTASASELVINGLDPYINVATVGDTTFGKPVGQSGFRFCDLVLRAVTFETVNVNDVGGYFNGIAPTCPATDELSEPFGSMTEASVEEAINYLSTGSCTVTSQKAATEMAQQKAMYPSELMVRDGWDVTTGGVR